MRQSKLAINTILFDLDNTLYSGECNLFSLIDVRINRFMVESTGIDAAEVNQLRLQYWKDYGTTLQGLIRHHQVDPEDYLDYVHDVDVRSRLKPDPELRHMLLQLSQRKVIFTNGSRCHVDRVLSALGVTGLFDDIFDVRVADYQPKPKVEPYQRILQKIQGKPQDCLMVEDAVDNLYTAKSLGMKTLLVGPPVEDERVDFRVDRVAQIAQVL